ncbi:MAG TPA: glutathionylspermidine synthase family protein [Dissulfurispiraceae bacterium]|nr:glutathionylspermidine synthase family protein [Dissulfurispiraceae bacterium]
MKKRDNWRQKFDELGFSFHSMGGTYWNEGACYEFSSDEIDHIEEVTAGLHALCIKAVDYVIDSNLFHRLGIPGAWASFATESWKRRDKSLYGRFDFSYDGHGEPKLLEYNADTPTSLVESSIAQWVWLEDMYPERDQFNSIHEKLIDAFVAVGAQLSPSQPFYFSCVKDHEEDFVTVEYLRDVAVQSGLDGRHIFMEDIGFDAGKRIFCDLGNKPIECAFKLYPWEWLLADEFGGQVMNGAVRFFEPPWKMILSNKGILPILWEMAPGHKNLLPAYFEDGRITGDIVRKPLFSREGANVTLRAGGRTYEGNDANYGIEGYVYQQAQMLPAFGDSYAAVGSWVVNGLPAGVGIREDRTPITTNTSMFVPHYFQS